MRDEIDGRLWVEHGAAFGQQVSRALASLGLSWRRLQSSKFDAPWRRNRAERSA